MVLLFWFVLGARVVLRRRFGLFYVCLRLVVGYWFGIVRASLQRFSVVVPYFDFGGHEAASASKGSDGEVRVRPV